MRNQPKPSSCKQHNRTRVVLNESEIQHRMSKPKRPTLAERYAEATEASERERWYSKDLRRYAGPKPNERATSRSNPPVWVTRSILRTRGWTDTAIREFLPRPESHRSNPHPDGSNRPMPLWSAATVGRTEATAAWQHWLRTSLRRRRLTLDDLADTPRDPAFRQRVNAVHAAITAYQNADAQRYKPAGAQVERTDGE